MGSHGSNLRLRELNSAASAVSQPVATPLVRAMQAADTARWDTYVFAAPEASFFHRAGWAQVLHTAFGHRAHYLLAERDGRICGVLPLVHMRSRIFGRALISVPFCVYGGVVADDEDTRKALTDAAVARAEELAVDYLELRGRTVQNPDWPSKDLYVTFRRAIDPDPDVNMKAIPRKQRAMIRKGIKAGLSAEPDPELTRFYACYSASVRNLGTPVFGRKYFQTLRTAFGPDCEILTVTHEGEALASVMSFYFRDEVLPYYGGGTAAARAVKANDFMYWELMQRAAKRGIRIFDYGRSKRGTGSFRFKTHWGFEPEALSYEYHLVRAQEMPDLSPANPRYRVFIDAWKRLPLPIAQALGPLIARNLG